MSGNNNIYFFAQIQILLKLPHFCGIFSPEKYASTRQVARWGGPGGVSAVRY